MKSTQGLLVTGGNGHLAQELLRIDPHIDAPSRKKLDVANDESIESYCRGKNIKTVIHAAAVTNLFNEDADDRYIESNIIGTANMVLWCKRNAVRLVYLSTDYVYPSERGEYGEESVLLPVNRYAKSKLGGEMSVQLYDNSLIVRTSFYRELKFDRACTDQFSSRLPIAKAAQEIYGLATRPDVRGIVNLGTSTKRSLFEIVRENYPQTKPCRRHELSVPYRIAPDSSMDTARYRRLTDSNTDSIALKRCRVCGSKKMRVYLDLGKTPLANSYLKKEQLGDPEFKEELAIQLCEVCSLSQLTKVVHPDLMFKNYLYVSSTPKTFRDHCDELSKTISAIASLKEGDLVRVVGSNDGCLLSYFRNRGMRVVGVDPAENLALEANQKQIPTVCGYWSKSTAMDVASRFGRPKVITSTNVLAHTHDVHEFAEAVEACLDPRGIWVVEVPYLLDFINHNEFDTAYHEHLSYFSLRAMSTLMEMHGFEVFDVHYFPSLHGGTIRVLASRRGQRPVGERVGLFLKKEAVFGVGRFSRYQAFAKRILENKKELKFLLAKLLKQGKTVWAYGASAKGNTLMNFFEIRKDQVPVVIDDNPKKWDYYAPGSHMRITGIEELEKNKEHVDYVLFLAWNFQREISQRCRKQGYRNKFILPVPTAKIIS